MGKLLPISVFGNDQRVEASIQTAIVILIARGLVAWAMPNGQCLFFSSNNYIGRRRSQFVKKTFNFFFACACCRYDFQQIFFFVRSVRLMGCWFGLFVFATTRDVVLFKWVMQIWRCEQLAQFVRIQTLWAISVVLTLEEDPYLIFSVPDCVDTNICDRCTIISDSNDIVVVIQRWKFNKNR